MEADRNVTPSLRRGNNHLRLGRALQPAGQVVFTTAGCCWKHKAFGGRGGWSPVTQGTASIYTSFWSKLGGLGTLGPRAWTGNVKPEEPKHCQREARTPTSLASIGVHTPSQAHTPSHRRSRPKGEALSQGVPRRPRPLPSCVKEGCPAGQVGAAGGRRVPTCRPESCTRRAW